MLGLKLNHVSKRDPRPSPSLLSVLGTQHAPYYNHCSVQRMTARQRETKAMGVMLEIAMLN